jgi:exonuclease III
MALNISICDVELLIVGIYGPNTNDPTFFKSLRKILEEYRHLPIICAGDWNTTYSTEQGDNNIDVINMINPPSVVRSGWLSEISEDLGLSDPFRVLSYTKKDFTYVPRTGEKNRSRIDFF